MLQDGRLRLNGAVFFEDYTDKQTQVQKVFNGQLGSVTENANGGEALGFEIDFAYAATDQFSVSGGYTYSWTLNTPTLLCPQEVRASLQESGIVRV